ncbi:MAG: hypothetical protein K0S91_3187, partial [Nitrososphaeraceae archaeon]|nr:hypothetical protein [Nitrososphaeraceae archaeon]
EVIIADKKSSRKTFKRTLYHIIDYDINAQDVDATMGLKKREQKEYNDADNVDNNNNHRDERQQKDDKPRAIKMAEELQKKERESEQVKIDPQEILEEEEKIQPQSQEE